MWPCRAPTARATQARAAAGGVPSAERCVRVRSHSHCAPPWSRRREPAAAVPVAVGRGQLAREAPQTTADRELFKSSATARITGGCNLSELFSVWSHSLQLVFFFLLLALTGFAHTWQSVPAVRLEGGWKQAPCCRCLCHVSTPTPFSGCL